MFHLVGSAGTGAEVSLRVLKAEAPSQLGVLWTVTLLSALLRAYWTEPCPPAAL